MSQPGKITAENNIQGISVFVLIDGQLCLMPVAEESSMAFIAMSSAFQSGAPKETKLIKLPDSVSRHIFAASNAIQDVITKAKKR